MPKIIKKITALFLCTIMIFSQSTTYLVYAENIDQAENDLSSNWGTPVVQIDNGVIKVTSDKQTGRFIVETLSGLPNKSSDDNKDLLYANRFEGPETSYISVRINGEDYIYGNDYGFLGLKGHYVTEPYVDKDTNTIISQWAINDIVIIQRLSLRNNPKLSSIGNVYVSYEIQNKGKDNKSVGIRALFDTKIGEVDSPALTVPGDGFIYKEKEYNKDEIPSLWYAYEQYITPQVIAMGLVSGDGLSKPDKLQFAAWGDVSQTKWDYTVDTDKPIIEVTVDGKPYDGPNGTYPDNSTVDYSVKDSCAVMYWNPTEIEPGGKRVVDTAYGVGDASLKDSDPGYRMSLQGTDKLNIKSDKSEYTIDYVTAEFNIDNNFDNSKNIDNMQIDLVLPDELELVEGNQKTVIKTLYRGSYERCMWKIKPKLQKNFIISSYSVILRAEGMPTQRINKVLLMEGTEGGLPDIAFLDSTPKTPFYVEDKNRSVFINGSGFNAFGSAIGQIMEAKLIQGNKNYSIDGSTFRKVSDTVLSVGVPDGIPTGNYDLFISAEDATGKKNDKKTFKNAVIISDDIKYSLNLLTELNFPIVMKDDGYNTPKETVTIYGKFVDNKNGTYTSIGATAQNPVKINNTLKYAGGTLTVNTNPKDASIEASDGILWCDIVNERSKTYSQAVLATKGFRFQCSSEIGDSDTFVRMAYYIDDSSAGSSYDVSYKNVPISLDKVIITSDGIDIKGSMGILNPLTYATNGFTPRKGTNDSLDKAMGELGAGYYQADIDNISVGSEGMDIEGRFSFQMPFAMSLFAGANAVLEINTAQEHIVVEVGVSIGEMMPESAGAKARIGLRKGRFDEIYVGAELPEPIEVAPPIPLGISGFSGGMKNLSFKGAFPITVILGMGIEDTTGIEFMGYNLLSAEGEVEVSPFHLIGSAEADLYMMDLAEVTAKFVWATWDPEIEKRGISIDATLHHNIFQGNVYLQYFEGESFLGRGSLSVVVPGVVPVIGGTTLADVSAELTQYSIAGSVSVLMVDIGIRYYFTTGKAEFLELKDQLEKAGNGIMVDYDNNCIAQYGYNFVPIPSTKYADENSQNITELNLTDNSNVMLVLRMTEDQFNNLDENSIKLVRPGTGGIYKIKYIDSKDLVKNGVIQDVKAETNEIIAIKQIVDNSDLGTENEYMVTIPVASPENGQWTVITKGAMEVLPYSTIKNPEITKFEPTFDNVAQKLSAKWILDGEPDKFRFYVVNSDKVTKEALDNPAFLWGTGTLLYGQTIKTKDHTDTTTGKTVQKEDEVVYTKPTEDGVEGTLTTDKLNLPSGKYYIYAKADKENTVAKYMVKSVEINNPSTPDPPSGLKVEDIGNNQIRISWDADYNMDQYYIYSKESQDAVYDMGTPAAVYNVYDPEDYTPSFENWPGNLPKERMQRFEVVIDGDKIDTSDPKEKTYYFDVRAVGNKTRLLSAVAEDKVNIDSGKTIGSPSSGIVTVGVPEEITVYTNIKSADSKIIQQPYVEKDVDEIEQKCYKYVTNSPNIIIEGSSDKDFKYEIQKNNGKIASLDSLILNYNEKMTLDEGNNYILVTYENKRGDKVTEEYMVEYDNKAPTLAVISPTAGTVAQNGKITVSGITDPYAVVSINNVNYDADENGKFNVDIDLGNSYVSSVKLEVRDSAGNVTTDEISVLNDLAEISDITLVPDYKIMTTGTSQSLSTYISKDEILGEKLPNDAVKYSIIQDSSCASITDDGLLTANYEGKIVVKTEYFVTDSASISDSIVIEISGKKEPHSSAKYYPPVYSREKLKWLAGSPMSVRGGTISTPDGLKLEVPKGALPYYQDNVDLFSFNDSQSIIEQMNLPDGVQVISQPYYISLLTDFIKPAKLTIPVNTVEDAHIYYYDEKIGALVYKGGTTAENKKSITADITKPGTYIVLKNPEQVTFADIPADYWGYDYIYGLNYLNIIKGYENEGSVCFAPEGKITRAEFIKLLVMSQNLNLSESEEMNLDFADSNSIPNWAVPYIKAAVMHGIVNGKSSGDKYYISPNDYITREEIASVIGRSVDSESRSDKSFNDNYNISSWAKEDIQELVDLGIISGYEDGSFKPKNNSTRAEAAAMIYKYLDMLR